MLGVVLLLAAQLVLYLANVNPFSKPALWVRRLSDPLLNPLRGWMRMRAIDQKYAPLLLIILVLLGGYFLIGLSEQVFTTLYALLNAVFSKRPKVALGWLLLGALNLYMLFLMGRILLSWIWSPYQNRLMRFLVKATDPLLAPLQQWLGPILSQYQTGGLNLAMFLIPLLAFIIVGLLQRVVVAFLLTGEALGLGF
jgi:uncharacterized protein YggT (Ycf19 family)